MSFGTYPEAVIPWVVQATLNILEVASRKPSIKRVVLASSSSATYPLTPEPKGREIHIGEWKDHVLSFTLITETVDTWNDAAVKAAWDDNTPQEERGVAVYAASKTEGERQSWKWIEEHRPQFEFNTVLPCFVVSISQMFKCVLPIDYDRWAKYFTPKLQALRWAGFATYSMVMIRHSLGSPNVRFPFNPLRSNDIGSYSNRSNIF